MLSNYYMGFERDLMYREYILQTEYLNHINLIYLDVFWISLFIFTCKEVKANFSLHVRFQFVVYFILSVITFMYNAEFLMSTMIFVLLNVFGILRVMVDLLRIKGNR